MDNLKDKIKNQLTLEQVFKLLSHYGGEPYYYKDDIIISATICHNGKGEGSHKLYYYGRNKLFHCYSGCENESFDIYELIIKIIKNQFNFDINLFQSIKIIMNFFNLSSERPETFGKQNILADWKILENAADCTLEESSYSLNIYDDSILKRFSYPRILSWEQEGISDKIIKNNMIGYYAGGEQITIPHFDIDGNLIGIRGRFLSSEAAELYGKYRPLYINKILYSHPLSLNLYGIDKSKKDIEKTKTAVIFESEKSVLQFQSFYDDINIAVACCGSNISKVQIDLLLSLGVKEIIIGFDKQFKELNTEESEKWKNKIVKISNIFKPYVNISTLWDKFDLLQYKDSPTDCGKEVFEILLKNKIML